MLTPNESTSIEMVQVHKDFVLGEIDSIMKVCDTRDPVYPDQTQPLSWHLGRLKTAIQQDNFQIIEEYKRGEGSWFPYHNIVQDYIDLVTHETPEMLIGSIQNTIRDLYELAQGDHAENIERLQALLSLDRWQLECFLSRRHIISVNDVEYELLRTKIGEIIQLNQEALNPAPQQSPSWEQYKDVSWFVERGFPFDEGMPTGGPYENAEKTFTVITRDGQRHTARVDYSTQYRSEGLQWRTTHGETFGKQVVLAWKENR